MTDMQHDEKTTQKPGQSIGFLRAAEKMQIATFEIPLTFLEDLGFSKDRIEAAKYMNRRFVSGFYARVRRMGDRLSFRGSHKEAAAGSAQAQKPKPKAEKAATSAKAAPAGKVSKAGESGAEAAKAPVAAKTEAKAKTGAKTAAQAESKGQPKTGKPGASAS
jgi:hypothetical protein